MSVSIIATIYSDRANGMLKSLQLQGMMQSSYLIGTGVYSFVVQLVYTFLFLSLLYATPGFRTAEEYTYASSYMP